MGGFHLFKRGSKETNNVVKPISHEKDTPLHPLAAIDLYGDNPTLDIDFSSFFVPTKAQIEDKGKSDWLAKSFVLLQTSWFVMQCIARAIKHLPVTHLEIVTLAYAAMNFVIYIFWWNKPLSVNQPVRVFRKSDPRMADNGIEPRGAGESRPTEMHPQPILKVQKLTWEAIGDGLETVFMFIGGAQDADVVLSRKDRVPRFWADSAGNDVIIADLIMFGIGICFGGIHCIAWIFSFPTQAELLIWRISSITITAVPTYIFLMTSLTTWLDHMGFDTADNIVGSIAGIPVLPAGLLYILARIFTLALALTSLRELPRGAFDTVHWTTFIPHI